MKIKMFFKYTLVITLILLSQMSLASSAVPVGEFITEDLTFSRKHKDKQLINWGQTIANSTQNSLKFILYPEMSFQIEPGSSIKIIGQFIKQDGKNILTEGAIQIIKGKLKGQIAKNAMIQNQLKVFGKKTLSSIRGTTFEIDVESAEELAVEEGKVEVELLEKKSTKIVEGQSNEAKQLIEHKLVISSWNENKQQVLSIHNKEAKRLQASLKKDIGMAYLNLNKDIRKSFEQHKGHYDQFKKK